MKNLIGILVILGAFAVLVVNSLKSNTMRVVPVHELLAQNSGQSFVGQNLRVGGFVSNEPVKSYSEQTPRGVVKAHHFTIVDEGKKVAVVYRDALPDTFRKGGPVQVDGLYKEAGLIEADHVRTKCPSKYEAESKAQAKKYNAEKSGAEKYGAEKYGVQKSVTQ